MIIPMPMPTPTQSVFALDTAGATMKHFESRHPRPHPSSSRAQTDVGVEQLEGEHRESVTVRMAVLVARATSRLASKLRPEEGREGHAM